MTTYRTGNHWGVTIVREGIDINPDVPARDDELVAVVVNGDQALAERICSLLNGELPGTAWSGCDIPGHQGCTPWLCQWAAPDSCTCQVPANRCDGHCSGNWADPDCSWHGTSPGRPDPNCPVHQGRRARGPKPPPLGPGCICDGSGRTCPRHGAVI